MFIFYACNPLGMKQGLTLIFLCDESTYNPIICAKDIMIIDLLLEVIRGMERVGDD